MKRNIHLRKATKADQKGIGEWLKKPHLLELFQHEPKWQKEGEFWLYLSGEKPVGLLALCAVTEAEPALASSRGALLALIAPLSATQDIEGWIPLLKGIKRAEGQLLLMQVAVQQKKVIAACEAAGLTRVASIVKGQGFFKGTPFHIFSVA
jgi:hypothetical protein